jgi:hypothetical protein
LPAHCFWLGPQTPVQAPATHVVLALHAVLPFCQTPLALHTSGCGPTQSVAPGVHMPVQAPATQAWLEHALPLFCQVALALQF